MINREEAIKKTLADIEAMEEVNAILPTVKKVFKQFDGKVFNCRLEKALKEALPDSYIYVNSTSYDNWIEVHMSAHIGNGWITILSGQKPTYQYYDPEKSFLTADKRIDAAQALKLIENGRVERLQKINSYKAFMEVEPQIQEQLNFLYKQISTITKAIPYTMQDYFGINR